MRLRLGTRGSVLARTQSGGVAGRLRALGHEVELVIVETDGDRDAVSAFADIGTFGIFVREIERRLLANDVDLAVHSYKDVPTRGRPEELAIVAVPERRDAADVLLAREGAIDPAAGDPLGLARGARVGTSSARRRAQIAALRPDLATTPLRGNVGTRVRRLREGACDATLLAAAGLARLREAPEPLDLEGLVVRRLPPDVFVPAPSQGALAVQVRADRADVVAAVAALDDRALAGALTAERTLLALVEGGCDLPFGAWAERDGGGLRLVAGLEVDGAFRRAERRGTDPTALARAVWADLTLSPRLAGRRVLVTRPDDGAADWVDELERLGAVPVLRPALATETLAGDGAAARARDALRGCAWLVLTSARAVDALEEILGRPPRVDAPVAVVGPATARRAREAGLDVRLESAGGTLRALAAELEAELARTAGTAAGETPVVLHAGAEETRPGLERLEESGRARIARLPVYRTRPAPHVPEAEREDLDVDVVLLASPSAVTGLAGRARIPARAQVVTIGPSTTAAAREAGLAVAGEAVTRDLLGMLRAIPREESR